MKEFFLAYLEVTPVLDLLRQRFCYRLIEIGNDLQS